jgi:hypothetical protein
VKTFLFALLVLSSAHAWAAEWRLYHESDQTGGRLFFDLDSLRQDRTGFDVDIRHPLDTESKAILTLLSVDCVADRYRLSHGRVVTGGATEPFATPDIWTPVERTPIATLKTRYCAYWYEPEGLSWQVFAESPGMTYYQLEDRQPEPARYPNGFAMLVKGLGREQAFLTEVTVLCPQNRYLFKQFVLRDEMRGVVAYHGEETLTPIVPGSWLDILKARYCATAAETAAKSVEEAR